MRKKLSLAALLALLVGLWGLAGPNATAEEGPCGENGPADVTEDDPTTEGNDAEADNLATVPGTESQVYGAQTQNEDGSPNGYVGIAGDTAGYIEADGGNQSLVEGSTNNGEVAGRVTIEPEPSVCVHPVTTAG